MKTGLILGGIALAAWSFGSLASAQVPASGPPPSPPAPPAVEATDVRPAQAPNQIVYDQQLPTAQDLINRAAAQGLVVDRIEQNANQILVYYKTPSGQPTLVAYQILPAPNAAAGSSTSTLVLPTTPAPAVVYVPRSRPAVYYDYDPYYYGPYGPWYGFGYPQLSLGIGLGYGFRGGFHHVGSFHSHAFYGRSFHGGFRVGRR